MKRVLILVRLSLLLAALTLMDVVHQQAGRLLINSCRPDQSAPPLVFSLPLSCPTVLSQDFIFPAETPVGSETPATESDGKDEDSDTPLSSVLANHSDVTVDRQVHVSTRLSAVNSQIAVATAQTAKVRHDVEAERKIATAQLHLQIATRNQNRYSDGESQLERTSLENQVQLARDKQSQLKERLTWSESLANGGLISQASLEIDVSAVKGSELELKAAEDRLAVFETFDLQRTQTQLETDVLFAQTEVESLQQTAASESQQLQSNYLAAKRDLDTLQDRVDQLNSATIVDPVPPRFDPIKRSGVAKDVELARAAMLHAERQLAAEKQRGEKASHTGQRLLEVQKLQYQAFLQSRESGTMHDLTSQIRMISEKLASAEQQLTWSRRVIRKGYITQAELRSAELTVNRRKAELTKVKRQETILAEHTLGRDEFELKTKLSHASKEVHRQQKLTEVHIKELQVIAEARRHIWEIRQEELAFVDRQQQDTVADASGK
jgi:hypothetical protein